MGVVFRGVLSVVVFSHLLPPKLLSFIRPAFVFLVSCDSSEVYVVLSCPAFVLLVSCFFHRRACGLCEKAVQCVYVDPFSGTQTREDGTTFRCRMLRVFDLLLGSVPSLISIINLCSAGLSTGAFHTFQLYSIARW